MFVDPDDKKIYRYFRTVKGTDEILQGNFLYGLWNYIKYTVSMLL